MCVHEVVNQEVVLAHIIDGVISEKLLLDVGTNSHVLLAERLDVGVDALAQLLGVRVSKALSGCKQRAR